MRFRLLAAAVAAAFVAPSLSIGAPLYSQNFEVDSSASWTVNNGPSDEAHDFFFDYSTVGIPKAPKSALADGTRGMKLQANLANGIFSGMSVSPTGQSFTAPYKVKFDWWANANGPFPAGGNGSTNLSTFGVGTSGTTAQWAGGAHDGIWFSATGEGGSSFDWRAYSPAAPGLYGDGHSVYAAAGAGNRNNTHPYYAGFGNESAPAAQVLLFPQQSGNTGVGTAGMTWHEVVIENDGVNVTWTVSGTLIATVPVGDDTVATGNNIFFGHSDINGTSSNDANAAALLFTLIDNISVVPEPGSLALCLFGMIGLLIRRRQV